MKIKLIRLMAGPLGIHHPGEILSVPEKVGRELILCAAAEEIPLNKKEKLIELAESAAMSPVVETAIVNQRGGRRG